MTNGIYNEPQAGLHAFSLFEELSESPSYGGWVELHKTIHRAKPGSPKRDYPERDYPPVYKVVYKPGFWDGITPAKLQALDDIAKRYDCTPHFTARNGGSGACHPECIVTFEHGRKDE